MDQECTWIKSVLLGTSMITHLQAQGLQSLLLCTSMIIHLQALGPICIDKPTKQVYNDVISGSIPVQQFRSTELMSLNNQIRNDKRLLISLSSGFAAMSLCVQVSTKVPPSRQLAASTHTTAHTLVFTAETLTGILNQQTRSARVFKRIMLSLRSRVEGARREHADGHSEASGLGADPQHWSIPRLFFRVSQMVVALFWVWNDEIHARGEASLANSQTNGETHTYTTRYERSLCSIGR